MKCQLSITDWDIKNKKLSPETLELFRLFVSRAVYEKTGVDDFELLKLKFNLTLQLGDLGESKDTLVQNENHDPVNDWEREEFFNAENDILGY